jgi:hypothetical protein
MIPDAIYDANGKVAVRYLTPIQKYIQLGNKHEYVFIPRFSVSLAWVDEEDATTLLTTQPAKQACCGGAQATSFILATQTMINCHTNGTR